MTPAEAAERADLGTAGARKSGRDPRWPFVPLVLWDDHGVARQRQIKGRAYATRDEAVAAAQTHIDALRRKLAQDLSTPRYRALRRKYGVPEEAI